MRVLMVTTSNRWDDTRLFWLESVSLTRLGTEVTILVVNYRVDAVDKDGVSVIALGRERSRVGRFLMNPIDAVRFCRQHGSSYDVLHIHDPEMLPWLARIRRVTGRPVVYDMREFLPDILSVRSWIPRSFRGCAPEVADAIERRSIRNANAVVVVNEPMELRVRQMGMSEVVIFMGVPSRTEAELALPYGSSRSGIVYVGGVSQVRGADTIAQIAPRIQESNGCSIVVAGPLRDQTAVDCIRVDGVDCRGFMSRSEVVRILNSAAIGWLPLHHTPNHEKGWALKLGEYMAAGLPVVISDLTYCSSVVSKRDCGIVVNSDDVDAHLHALRYLLNNPDEAKRMGANGRRAILEDLNSETYASKLQELYKRLLGQSTTP